MSKAITEAFSTSSSAETSELLALLTKSLVRLLRAGGLSRDQIIDAVSNALATKDATSHAQTSITLGQVQRDCMEVLCLWRRDTDFLTEDGLPAILPIDGDSKSFHAICSRARATTETRKLLETLRCFGAISFTDDARVALETPTFLLSAGPGSAQLAIDGVLKQIAGFIRVVEHNILDAECSSRRRFERACTVVVAEELLPVFERIVANRGQDFIDVLDEWLERHCVAISPSNRYVEMGVGAYFVNLGSVIKEI